MSLSFGQSICGCFLFFLGAWSMHISFATTGEFISGSTASDTSIIETLYDTQENTYVITDIYTGDIATGDITLTGNVFSGTLFSGITMTGTLFTGNIFTGNILTGEILTGTILFTGNIFSGGVATGDIGSGSNEYARQELSLTEQYALGTPKSLETLDEKEREPTSIDVKNMARITEKKQLQQVIIDIAPEDIFDTIDNLTIIQEKVLSQ